MQLPHFKQPSTRIGLQTSSGCSFPVAYCTLQLFVSGMSNLPDNSGPTYVITLRAERPIEGCELTPNAFLQLKGGNMDNSARAKLLDSKPFQYIFSWSRGPRCRICSNHECPRGDSCDPAMWSKAALGGPNLVCNVCLTAGKQAHEASFCSISCFKSAWRAHSSIHSQYKFQSTLLKDADPLTPLTPVEEEVSGNGNGFNSSPSLGSIQAWARKQASNQASEAVAEGWVIISSDKEYTPCSADVGSRLRIEVKAVALADGELLAGPISICTEAVLQAPGAPPKRSLLTIPGAGGSGASGAFRFRIVSYNILAELFATKQAYPYCDSWCLSWPYRRRIILQELEEAQGDVVCLQEVQADYFEQHINPFMNELGYDGLFKQKSRDFTGSYVKVDGCATFWKRSKFILVENYCIEFNDIARQEVGRLGLDDLEARKFMNRLSRDNVAQVVVLEALRAARPGAPPLPRSSVCIANTHLYSNVQRADVKLWQTVNLVRELRHFLAARDLPLLLCGDFNSEPESAVYEYLMSGMIASNRPELSHVNTQDNGNVRILPDTHHLTHDLALSSALSTTLGNEPAFTNYTARFKGTLDYIYYTPSRLRVLAATSMPEEADLRATSGEGLPSACYPSDHLMLCCDVAMIASGNGSILNSDMSTIRGSNIPSMMRTHNSTSNLSAAGAATTSTTGGAGGGLPRTHNSTNSLPTTGVSGGGSINRLMSSGRKIG